MTEEDALIIVMVMIVIIMAALALPLSMIVGIGIGAAGGYAFRKVVLPRLCGGENTTEPALAKQSTESPDPTLASRVLNALRGADPTTVPDGDEQIASKMQDVSKRNREAIHMQARSTSDNARKYFAEELDEQENRHWYENDSLDVFMHRE